MAAPPNPAVGIPLRFEGNQILPNEVYTSVLDLALTSTSTTLTDIETTSQFVETQLLKFLRSSGYLLATVEATPHKRGGLTVRIDEGILDRVIILGQGVVRTLETQISLDLPRQVFNRFVLERQLADLVRRRGLDEATYEVLPMEKVDHAGIQLPPSALLGSNVDVSPGVPHELVIRLKHPDWRTGFDLGIGFRSPDGFHGSAIYRQESVFIEDDRTFTELTVAFRSFEALFSSNNNTGVSRAALDNRWYGPPLLGRELRPRVSLDLQLQSRFRTDLNIEEYLFAPVALSLQLAYEPVRGLQVALGGGVQFRKLFNVRAESDNVELLVRTDEQTVRGFGQLDVVWNREPEEMRLDRQETVRLIAQYFSSGGTTNDVPFDGFFRLQAMYDKMFSIGYDELWLALDGALLTGDVPFYDEVALGDGFVRLGYGGDFFIRRAASFNIEYRLSLVRESFKLSIFNDAAIFAELGPDRETTGLQFSDSVGLGLHFLVLTTFQVNFYGGAGFVPGLKPVPGVSLQVTQAF